MATRSRIVPCIWLDDSAEEAAAFYVRTFPGGRLTATSYFPESGDNPPGKPPGSVLTVEFEVDGLRFTVLNGGPMFVLNPSISFFFHVDNAAEAERLFAILAEGGETLMPLGDYPWSLRYGWVKDRFGVSWQVIAGRRPQGEAMIVPCLMFAGAQHGRAEEAMGRYGSIFPGGRILGVERYTADEGPAGTVKHGRFVLDGQEMIALDGGSEHGFTFNEALSFQVMCEDQDEVDRYWEALGDGGEFSQCGWLKDRFGVSWQVVPSAVLEWLTSEDVKARDRAFAAIMEMSKIDIATIQRAWEG